MARWGIVGGGMLGMTLAHRLRARGHDVTLLEAADSPGGLASAWQVGDVTWDRHYHVMLTSDLHLLGLLGELGLRDEVVWSETRTGFFAGGQFHSMSNAIEFLRFPVLGLIAKCRLALTILVASRIRNWRPLEQITVVDWLRRWSGRHTVERIWLPLLRSKLGEAYQRTAASFIWATIARMYAARRAGLKQEQFGYVAGGYARILQRFTEVLEKNGVELVCKAPVHLVTSAADGRPELQYGKGQKQTFDQLIMTVPATVVQRTCPELSVAELRRYEKIEYIGIVCASVLLRERLTDYYITNITDAGLPFTAVIEMSALVDPEQLGGHVLVYLPKYVAPDDPIFAQTDAEIEAAFLAGLRRMHPQLTEDDVVAFRISRVRQVFALPTLNYSAQLPPVSTSQTGLSILNSAHIVNGTLNVNETVALADTYLPELLGECHD